MFDSDEKHTHAHAYTHTHIPYQLYMEKYVWVVRAPSFAHPIPVRVYNISSAVTQIKEQQLQQQYKAAAAGSEWHDQRTKSIQIHTT